MNKKMLLYMMTGNIMFLFMPTQMALMMMMLGGIGTTAQGTNQVSSGTDMSSMLPLMLMSGSGSSGRRSGYRSYKRPTRVIVQSRRY